MPEFNFNFYVSGIFNVFNKSYNPSKKLTTKLHTEYTVSLCTGGEGLYIIDGKKYAINSGDIAFFPKNTLRSYQNAPGKDWSYITINFYIDALDGSDDFILNNINKFYRDVPYEISQLFKKFYAEWSGRSFGYRLKCRTIAQEIVLELIKLSNSTQFSVTYSKEIERARKYIQSHIKDNIDFEKLISDSALSPTHFRRLFKKIVGYSPRDYYNYIKISLAKDMLKSRAFTVSEVAEEMGYSSVYYFSATFKKYFKVSPSNYIKHKKAM